MTTDTQAIAGDLYALVVYVHKHCNADFFQAVAELDLSFSQIKLLHHLEEADGDLTLKTLAEKVPVSLPAASRAIDDLVRRDFVARWEDPDDRRMKRVALTDHGRSVGKKLNAARFNGLKAFAATLDQAETNALAAALSTLLARPDVAACRPTPTPEA